MPGLSFGAVTPLASEASALVEWLRRSVVVVRTPHGQGAGIIWQSDGLIITNHHVAGNGPVEVELADGRRMAGQTVARDEHNDLAAVRISASDLPAAFIGDSRSLRVGELLVAVGHPLGTLNSATLGIVSGVGGALWIGRSRREMLQADIELAPGNSGGPLADTNGRVVGVASMIVSPGIAIAIPSHVVEQFIERYQQQARARSRAA